jgi:hypothetical protein
MQQQWKNHELKVRTFSYTIKQNTNNINSIKMWFSNKIIVNLQNQKLYKESKHKDKNTRQQVIYLFIHLF